MEDDKLTRAVASLDPVRPYGPWSVICDNETFMKTAGSKEAVGDCNMKLWHVPAKSPDLNPVEKYWAWLRKKLHQRDLLDLNKKRAVLTKPQYQARVREIMRSRKSQAVGKSCFRGLRKVCRLVIKKKGAAVK